MDASTWEPGRQLSDPMMHALLTAETRHSFGIHQMDNVDTLDAKLPQRLNVLPEHIHFFTMMAQKF